MAALFFPFFWPHCIAYGILVQVPQPGIKHTLPALEAWHLNLWTTREVPAALFSSVNFTTFYLHWHHHCCYPVDGDKLLWVMLAHCHQLPEYAVILLNKSLIAKQGRKQILLYSASGSERLTLPRVLTEQPTRRPLQCLCAGVLPFIGN